MGKLREVLEHPDELVPLIQMAYAAERAKVLPKDENLAFCYSMLNRVSRRCCLDTFIKFSSSLLIDAEPTEMGGL